MTAYAITDSTTMLRRSLRRMRRYPSLTFFIAALPVVLLLLFVYVFGGTLGAGLGGPVVDAGGRDAYLAYVVPGNPAADGRRRRHRDRDLGRDGHDRGDHRPLPDHGDRPRRPCWPGTSLGSVIQTFLALGLVVVVAVVIGYRPAAGPLAWLAAAGLLVLTAVAVTWLSVGMGLATDSVETASNTPMILMLLLFLSAAFVPDGTRCRTRSRWFAEHQPFTPIIETLRGLLSARRSATAGSSRSLVRRDLDRAAISGRGGSTSACRHGQERREARPDAALADQPLEEVVELRGRVVAEPGVDLRRLDDRARRRASASGTAPRSRGAAMGPADGSPAAIRSIAARCGRIVAGSTSGAIARSRADVQRHAGAEEPPRPAQDDDARVQRLAPLDPRHDADDRVLELGRRHQAAAAARAPLGLLRRTAAAPSRRRGGT